MVGTLFPHKPTFLLEHNLTQNTNIQIHSHPNFQSPKKKNKKDPELISKRKSTQALQTRIQPLKKTHKMR